jgi:hypothetical protein
MKTLKIPRIVYICSDIKVFTCSIMKSKTDSDQPLDTNKRKILFNTIKQKSVQKMKLFFDILVH